MNDSLFRQITDKFPTIAVSRSVSWKKVTTLGVGLSPLPMIVEPSDEIELSNFLKWCTAASIPLLVLGNGSNWVGSDRPFLGVVIKLSAPKFCEIHNSHDLWEIGAGVLLGNIVRHLVSEGFGGLSELISIPATIGGAIRMNAGAHGKNISDKLLSIRGFRYDGSAWCAEYKKNDDNSELKFTYRSSNIPSDVIVTGATFHFEKTDINLEKKIMSEAIQFRLKNHPQGRSAGCVFKNPLNKSAGLLIDQCGLKGHRVGDIVVSPIHANYFINEGMGSEKDFRILFNQVRDEVAKKHGIDLQSEVQFIE